MIRCAEIGGRTPSDEQNRTQTRKDGVEETLTVKLEVQRRDAM